MLSSSEPPTRLRTAIAISLAGHLCVLAVFAAMLDERRLPFADETESGAFSVTLVGPRPQAMSSRVLERLVKVPRPSTIVRQQAPSAAARVARAAAATLHPGSRSTSTRDGSPPSSGPARSALLGVPHFSLALVPRTPATETPEASLPTVAPSAPAVAAVPTAEPTIVPTPATLASPMASTGDSATAGFSGLFSQNYPPALAAPTALAQIRAEFNGPVRARIEVDETGRATSVRFERAPADAALEDELRSRLLALHYVPADCNGLHCDGTLELAY